MTTEDKALALVNEVRRARGLGPYFECDRTCAEDEALCRAIEQHEAFRQEVSDALQSWVDGGIDRPAYLWFRKNLEQFIIHEPKPDPLLAAMNEVIKTADVVQANADQLRAALDARGFEIREKNDG